MSDVHQVKAGHIFAPNVVESDSVTIAHRAIEHSTTCDPLKTGQASPWGNKVRHIVDQ